MTPVFPNRAGRYSGDGKVIRQGVRVWFQARCIARTRPIALRYIIWQPTCHSAPREFEASHYFSEDPMRCVTGLLAVVCAGGLSLALADPPTTDPAASTPPTQVEPASPALPATPNAAPVTPAQAVPATPAAPTAATHTEQLEKQLRAQGYAVQMRNGDRVFCRREVPLGSHLPTALNCLTADEAERMAQAAKGDIEHSQRRMTSCLMNANGRSANCGN